jgi:hypothetical protein
LCILGSKAILLPNVLAPSEGLPRNVAAPVIDIYPARKRKNLDNCCYVQMVKQPI